MKQELAEAKGPARIQAKLAEAAAGNWNHQQGGK